MGDAKLSPVEALLNAEKEADEIVAQARKEAEQIIAAAHKRAGEIRQGAGPRLHLETPASRQRQELDLRKRVVSENADRIIQQMRSAAEAKLDGAVEKVFLVLVGES